MLTFDQLRFFETWNDTSGRNLPKLGSTFSTERKFQLHLGYWRAKPWSELHIDFDVNNEVHTHAADTLINLDV